VNCAEVILNTRPVHIEHDTKTEMDELQEAVTQQASRVGNYLWSIYESSTSSNNTNTNISTTENGTSTNPSEEKSNENPSSTTLITSILNWANKEPQPETKTSESNLSTQAPTDASLKPAPTDQPPISPRSISEKLTSYIPSVPSSTTVSNFIDSFWSKK